MLYHLEPCLVRLRVPGGRRLTSLPVYLFCYMDCAYTPARYHKCTWAAPIVIRFAKDDKPCSMPNFLLTLLYSGWAFRVSCDALSLSTDFSNLCLLYMVAVVAGSATEHQLSLLVVWCCWCYLHDQ